MNENNVDKKNLIIVLLLIIVVILCIILFVVVNDKFIKTRDHTVSDVIEKEDDLIDEISKLNKEEALKLGNELYKYAYSTYWGEEPAWKSYLGEVNQDGSREKICETTPEEVREKYSKDFILKEYSSNKEYDLDYLVEPKLKDNKCGGHARGGLQTYDTTTLKVKNIGENKIVFEAESVYCTSSFCENGHDAGETKVNQFIIVKDNDKWLIQYFVLPN